MSKYAYIADLEAVVELQKHSEQLVIDGNNERKIYRGKLYYDINGEVKSNIPITIELPESNVYDTPYLPLAVLKGLMLSKAESQIKELKELWNQIQKISSKYQENWDIELIEHRMKNQKKS